MQNKNDNTEAFLQQLETLEEAGVSAENFRKRLSAFINDLISNDFEKLVQVLYRLDIDEIKLKKTLREHADHDAGEMITDLIIERQLQKIKSRESFRQPDRDINEEEKW